LTKEALIGLISAVKGDTAMPYFTEETRKAARDSVRMALAEDLGTAGDITSRATIPEGLSAKGSYVFQEPALVAGAGVLEEVCRQISRKILIEVLRGDGEEVKAGETALRVYGPARALLAVERTSLNFLSHLSGIATLTRKYVDAVKGTGCAIFDTRKTIPGLRALQKYAVRCGGGVNHRMGLYDQVLIKDNHLALMDWALGGKGLVDAVARARRESPKEVLVEIEAKTLDEVQAAAAAGADIIMLDNMSAAMMKKAVALVDRKGAGAPTIEASGGVNIRNVARIAATGVDRISVGALTHSVPSIDISLEIESD
jgi:nicotinate-nucleotide pyrophosphorylase (carboxylating)